jgi:hypothetical protein
MKSSITSDSVSPIVPYIFNLACMVFYIYFHEYISMFLCYMMGLKLMSILF